jgi:hypothetical protein
MKTNGNAMKPPYAGELKPGHLPVKLIESLSIPVFGMLLLLLFKPQPASAVPGFARQTGLSCSACHNMFPEINSFGREFKLNGYTLSNMNTLIEKNDKEEILLKLLSYSPLSAMVQASFTSINTKIPETQNNNIELPQQLSLFYTGLISPHIGSFIQLTYSGMDGTLGMDNVDIRYNNMAMISSKRLIYGATLNNNPSVQDVWNSIPAWRFPYATSDFAPAPSAAPLIEGALAQQVAGLGAYAFFNNLVYAELSGYRSAQQGVTLPYGPTATGVIKGVAPYWRLALQHNWGQHYLEAGTSGMSIRLYPTGVSGLTDNYTDLGFDLQYEYKFPKSTFKLHPLWFHESQQLDATFASEGSQNKNNSLNSLKIAAELYSDKGLGATLGYFAVKGSQDNGLYTSSAITGSATGSPDSEGFIGELSYLPWYNTKFSVQYTFYNKFNGASKNYDGFGRNASDNNTLYLLVWLCF